MAEKKAPTNPQEQTTKGPAFTVHNVYLKDASFESPDSLHVFQLQWKPKMNFDLQMRSNKVEDSVYEVILHITVTVTLKDKHEKEVNAFLTEIQQAGVFSLQGFTHDQLDRVLSTTCPTVLFPYLRETVSSFVTKGGFPQLVLPPMNFDAMYAKHLQEKAPVKAQEKKG